MKKLMLTTLGVAAMVCGAETYPYGVCAHVTRSEKGARFGKTMTAMELAGMRYVRSDFDSYGVKYKDGTFNFETYDKLVADLESRNIKLLPIIYGPWGGKPPASEGEIAEYRNYIKEIIKHYGKRFPVVEIWNEANLNGFFRGADPAVYAQTLKIAYEAVKSVDPSIRVAFTGTAGVPFDWIRKVLENGAAKSFDIMNVHPYSHPSQPEGVMDAQTEKLKALLAEFGRADAPIWFTEIGWPTHSIGVTLPHIIQAGLKVARPEQKSWNVVVADLQLAGDVADQTLADALSEILPAGSNAKVCSQNETCRLLAAGGVDAVFYPFDESFPSDTIDAVNNFVKKGGVFVDMGGLPCYFGRRNGEGVRGMQHGGALGKFPFGYRAWWIGLKGDFSEQAMVYPREAQVFATEAGLAAGVKQEPTGFKAMRYLAPDRIGKDSEWIPLVAGKTTNGVDLVAAAVIRYKGERTGAAVLSSLYAQKGGGNGIGTNNEENQANFTARGLGLAFAEGVEAYFTYNLRSFGADPLYSEHHFGLMQQNFQPKPAFSAYAQFVEARPAGSVQKAGEWHDKNREFFYPQWVRPDGAKAGMVWTPFNGGKRQLRFTGGTPTFYNIYGRKIIVRELEKGLFNVPVAQSPVYFIGAELAQ